MPSPAAIHSVLRLGRMALFAAEENPEPINSPALWWKLGISACLILAGGVFAGLTLGLMGLDELHLRVLSVSSDDEKERENARIVLDLLKKGRHWVLVSLLLSNVVVNESLPIFLDSAIGGGIAAVAISTTMIGAYLPCYIWVSTAPCVPTVFGASLMQIRDLVVSEVIPQAICARYGLVIGARCAKFVLGLMWLLSPIAYPTAKLLDRVLGAAEENTYKKAELRTFLQFHRQGEEPLRDDEIAILNGVLSLNETQVAQIMTPMKDVFTLEQNDVLDHAMVDKLLLSGYSRVPVHEAGAPLSFVGLLLLKKLLTYDPSQCKKVSDFALSLLPEAAEDINCFQALDYFQTGRAHLLLISKTPGEPGGAIGVITLEDVIEEIIAEEIVDEFDQYESNSSKRRAKRMSTAAVMKGIVERNLNKQTEGPRPVNESTKLVHSNGNGKAPANYSSTS